MQYNQLEGLLYNYNNLIAQNKIRLLYLKETNSLGLPTPKYDDVVVQTDINKSRLEDAAIDNIQDKERLRIDYRKTNKEIQYVNYLVGSLPSLEKQIIKLRYFEGLTWPEISSRLYIVESTAKKRRRRAIERMLDIINKI